MLIECLFEVQRGNQWSKVMNQSEFNNYNFQRHSALLKLSPPHPVIKKKN